jgi:hypothetical protein
MQLLFHALALAWAGSHPTSRIQPSAIRMADAWELRVAAPVDVDTIAKMSKLPSAVVSAFVGNKLSCVATDIDGTVLAFTLVNAFKRVKNKQLGAAGGFETTGEIMKAAANAKGNAYMRQTSQGSMKLLKGMGGSEMRCSVSSGDLDMITYLMNLGFTEESRSADFNNMKANLFAVNTDPGKKIDSGPVVRKAVSFAAPEPAAEEPSAEVPAEETAPAPAEEPAPVA